MPSVLNNWRQKYPKLPMLVANTMASKIIQLVKDGVIEPAFNSEFAAKNIRTWPMPVKKTAEWVLYTLSGVMRTIPDQTHPVGNMFKEALEDSLTNVGIKLGEISRDDGVIIGEIVGDTLPMLRTKLIGSAIKDQQFREKVDTILGTSRDWVNLLREWQGGNSAWREKIKNHRDARKARGLWGRFVWKK